MSTNRSSKYQVYAHLINGVVFYIGCGLRNRPWEYRARTARWKKILSESSGSFEVKILSEHTDKGQAIAEESRAIAKLKPAANVRSNPVASQRSRYNYREKLSPDELSRLKVCDGKSTLSIRVSKEFLHYVRRAAVTSDMSRRDLVIQAVLQYAQKILENDREKL